MEPNYKSDLSERTPLLSNELNQSTESTSSWKEVSWIRLKLWQKVLVVGMPIFLVFLFVICLSLQFAIRWVSEHSGKFKTIYFKLKYNTVYT